MAMGFGVSEIEIWIITGFSMDGMLFVTDISLSLYSICDDDPS